MKMCSLAFQSVPSSISTPFLIVKAGRIAVAPSLLQCTRASLPAPCAFTVAYKDIIDRVGSRRIGPVRCFSALTPELKTTLDKVVTSHKVVLFMKGTKEFPQCGFSHTVVQILKSLNIPFETINILENDMLRQGLKEYSHWPTFPQLYIDGEFFGGCDIALGSKWKTDEFLGLFQQVRLGCSNGGNYVEARRRKEGLMTFSTFGKKGYC